MKTQLDSENNVNMARRSFLRYAGVGAAAVTGAMVLDSCKKKDNDVPTPVNTIDIGAGDIGILNFAYALEQLEAAFYIQAVANPYSGISQSERDLLTDIRDHEVAHRQFFKAAIGGSAINALTVDFSSIDFSNRDKVLAAAKAFEDTGVGAYNGAGYLIKDVNYLALAGKIVSVEARHAAYIRALISPASFADSTILDGNAMDKQLTIAQSLTIANTYLKTKVSAASFNYVP
ncbi:ferritin-like domain-containing protein [Mucilaginibacter myungsuensis]|uniref:Ferritin-like domain-containing protein n=1 Tax=Mucilaginibacter myungsuensis TaxID=649104 RepID=A0A929KU92_9SPHI|nr:ferritin-like domain-containing protein [Mucilaginibacter myungsuensis]MBE9660535.1 ferritin-like domain-containing protein [Mucilaginibacter myungsuensis]MDN3600580.1 ferritin-like domain-containing protein [Mucilaginibacter myungsuensis]